LGWKEIKAKLKWFDPFTYVDMLLDKYNPSRNQLIDIPVYFISAFIFALIIYTVLGLLLGTQTPMVIVVSQSMEPTMYRGDVIVLTGVTAANVNAPAVNIPNSLDREGLSSFATADYPSKTLDFFNDKSIVYSQIGDGDIIVYQSSLSPEAIIHRAIAKVHAEDGSYIITKGDNNSRIDQDCGRVIAGNPSYACISLYPVTDGEIDGKHLFRIPLIGYVKLLLFDDLPALLSGKPIPSLNQGSVMQMN